MKKRLRKKLRKGEFQELGCAVQFTLDPGLTGQHLEAFIDSFLDEAIEAQGLGFGGGGQYDWSGFVAVLGRRGSVTEANRTEIGRWLEARSEVTSHTVGPLTDAWHGVSQGV